MNKRKGHLSGNVSRERERERERERRGREGVRERKRGRLNEEIRGKRRDSR